MFLVPATGVLRYFNKKLIIVLEIIPESCNLLLYAFKRLRTGIRGLPENGKLK